VPRDKVGISIATKGTVRLETAQWFARALHQLSPYVEDLSVLTPRPLEHARNLQRLRFLESTCTHLFILDSDCIPPEYAIQKLLLHRKPIISAPHRSVIGQEVGLMVLDRVSDGYRQHHPMSGFQGPDVVVGSSGLLIAREVLEKLGPFRFLYDDQGRLIKSEDFDFCDRAHEAGYEIWADCDLQQNHVVTVTV